MRRYQIKKQNAIKKQNRTSILKNTPLDVKQRVASFLSTRDVVRLVMAAKSMMSELDLTVKSSPMTDQTSQTKVFQTCHSNQVFAAAIPKPAIRFHSMAFSCKIDGQGWSDGYIWIVQQELPSNHDHSILATVALNAGKVVACANIDERKAVSLPFSIQPNKFYQLVINTKGYEDTQLKLADMRLHRIGYGPMDDVYTVYQYDVNRWVTTSFTRALMP